MANDYLTELHGNDIEILDLKVVGTSPERKDMVPKCTGTGKYACDWILPGMLEGVMLKSPYAHAKIKSIDATQALNTPGVVCVVTGDDGTMLPATVDTYYYPLASTPMEVYFAGQAVALLAAETREVAEEAIKLINVVYEELPAVFDPKEAMTASAPELHPDSTAANPHLPKNVAPSFMGFRASRKGKDLKQAKKDLNATKADIEQGKIDADVTLTRNYTAGCECHMQMETQRATAYWEGKKLTVFSSTQDIHMAQGGGFMPGLNVFFGIPENDINVRADWVGGGFGGKFGSEAILTAAWAAALAKKSKRPVRFKFTTDENNIVQHHCCGPFYYDTTGGIKNDGTPTFLETSLIANAGGVQGGGLNAAYPAGESAIAVYNYESIWNEALPVWCNLNLPGARRSYGDAEGMMCSEQFIDEMLAEINADPVEWRKKWAEKPGDPCTLRYAWSEFCGGNYVALIEKAAAEFGWNEKWKGWGVPISVNGDKKRGIGVALSMHITGTSGMRGLVKVNNDGSVNVLGAVMDVGQGIKTATAQCVAEVLGVPYDKVTCNLSNTEGQVPGGVCASLGTPCVIGAAINAAWNAKEQLFDLAAAALGVSVKDLDIGDEKIFVKADPSKFRTIAALAASRSMIIGHGWEVWPWKNADGFPLAEKSLAAMFAEVEVDTGTGKIDIIEMVSAADCGQVIHRDSVFGQMYQGVVFGYGYGMYGNLIYDKAYQGIALNVDALNYRIPTAIEYGDIHCIIHTDPADAPTCNMGVKGCGEGTNVPVAPAIGNAFFNATGARLRHHPWTPDKVLEALGKI